MKISKKKIILIVISILLIIAVIAIGYYLKQNSGDIIRKRAIKLTTNEVLDKIRNEDNSVDYKDFISIKMKDSEILYNHTSSEAFVDNEFCNLMYSVRVENITDEEIELRVVYYLPTILYNTLKMSSSDFRLIASALRLDPGVGLRSEAGIGMTHYDKLTEEEKEIFEKYKNDLYVLLMVNGEEIYLEIDDLKVLE